MKEAHLVLNTLMSVQHASKPRDSITVGVVSPYSAQRNLLRTLVQKNMVGTCLHVEVATVDGLQGAEKDLIIFSATRSNPAGSLGFVADARRANVLLTRAKRGLV